MKYSKGKRSLGVIAGIIVIFAILVVISYFESNRDITITQTREVGQIDEDIEDSTVQQEQAVPVQKKEFTEFGDFWIEINKEGYNLKAPILDGVEKDDLKRGVGHHSTTALPNPDSGNVVLSGHRWLPGSNPANTVFRHLDKLSVGDSVSIFREGKQYIYRVRESKTVSNDAVEILDDTESPQLTLYTCTPLFTALKRLVYIADLVEVK